MKFLSLYISAQRSDMRSNDDLAMCLSIRQRKKTFKKPFTPSLRALMRRVLMDYLMEDPGGNLSLLSKASEIELNLLFFIVTLRLTHFMANLKGSSQVCTELK